MAIENINSYSERWQNGVSVGAMWDKIKEKFVSGSHVQSDATTYPATWKQQARANIGLTIENNKIWYGNGANTIGQLPTSAYGRALLNAAIYQSGQTSKDTIWCGKANYDVNESPIDKLIVEQVGRDVLATTGASAVTNLWATKATQDGNEKTISAWYAHSLAFATNDNVTTLNLVASDSTLLSSVAVNAKLGLLRLDNNGDVGKIPLVHIPDAILGQLTYGGTITYHIIGNDSLNVSITSGAKSILEQKTGRTIGNRQVRLVSTSSRQTTELYIEFNYEDCMGMYFIWTAAALETHSGETEKYLIWPANSGKRYQSGDWLISNDTEWDKVDNTDAVTGVKGSNESTYRLNNVSIDALDVRALATYATSGGQQTVADNVQFNKNVWALGGMAANGLTDLALAGGGGGGGTVTRIKIGSSATAYEPTAGLVTIPVTTGNSTPAGSFGLGGQDIAVKGLGSLAFKSSFSLTELEDASDIQAIELLSGTSGFLKKTAADTWALDTTVVTTTASQALTNKTYNGYTLAAACAKGVDTSLTASSTSANLPTSAAVASLVSGYLPKSGGMIDGTSAYPLQISGNTVRAGITYYHSDTTTAFGTIGVYESSTGVYNPFFGQGNNTYKIWHENNDGSGSGLDADTLDGTHKSGLFTLLENSSEQVSVTIGGTNKKLTVDYATKALQMKQEPKPDQEFVYRQSPQTIDADSLVINKFKGRTLAWNQYVNSVWNNAQVIGVNFNGVTTDYSSSTNLYYVHGTASGGTYDRSICRYKVPNGHQVLLYAPALPTGDSGNVRLYLNNNGGGSAIYNGEIGTQNDSRDTIEIYLRVNNGTAINKYFSMVIIDLTLLFNGNVPSGYTASDFKRDFPDYPTAFNAGELRNNDAKGLETVGLNLWDEEWEQGQYSTTGYPASDDTAIRSKNYIPIIAGLDYNFRWSPSGSNPVVRFCTYDYDKNLLSGEVYSLDGLSSNVRYIKFSAIRYSVSGQNIYKHDICINISDPNRNGQYEPYKRIVSDLHLDNIQVKSHNIWDEEWELKGLNTTTGEWDYTTIRVASRNHIPVLPNTTYYIKKNVDAYIVFYDGNKNYLTNIAVSGNTFTTPYDCGYIQFQMYAGYGSTYNNDICINESSSFNGQYEPHGILTFNGLKSAGDVYDEIVNNGAIEVRKIHNVFLKDLTWTNYQTGRYRALLPASNKKVSANVVPNALCDRFTVKSENGATGQVGEMWFNTSDNYVYIGANAAPTEGELNYELENYETYDLVAPIPTAMPAGTTERRLPEDTSDSVLAPFACDMTYGTNPGDILASGIAWEKIWGRPQLAKGSYSDSVITGSGEWFKLDVGGQVLYVQFAVGTGAFRLKIADSDDEDAATVSKEFAFATLSTADIDAICV